MAVVNPLPSSHLLDAVESDQIKQLQVPECDEPSTTNEQVLRFPIRYDFKVDRNCRIAVNISDKRESSYYGVTNLVFGPNREEIGRQETEYRPRTIEFGSGGGGEYSIFIAETYQIDDFFDETSRVTIANLLSSLINRFRGTIGMPEEQQIDSIYSTELKLGDVLLTVQFIPIRIQEPKKP
jgi:hypothetical protein